MKLGPKTNENGVVRFPAFRLHGMDRPTHRVHVAQYLCTVLKTGSGRRSWTTLRVERVLIMVSATTSPNIKITNGT